MKYSYDNDSGSTLVNSPTTAGSLTGQAYDWNSAYGGKANVPSTATSAADAISGNISNLSSLYGLADSQNQFSANQAVKTQETLTPGYSSNMSKWASDIADLLSGKVSSGTINTISQQAAERGVSSGISGSQTNESSLLRALGLTSEAQQATGASQLTAMINASPKSTTFDMTPYLTTADQQQQAQYAANTIASAATPSAASAAATDAAKAGVSYGSNAAGSAPATSTGTNSSIASLLSSILGTGSSGGASASGGGTASSGPAANQSFEDWYKSVYGAGAYGSEGSTVATEPDNSNLYDNSGAFDASAYA